MNWKDLQLFIPGWNAIYLIKTCMQWTKIAHQQRDETLEFIASEKENLTIAFFYEKRIDQAIAIGDLKTVSDLDNKLYEFSMRPSTYKRRDSGL